MAQPMKGKHLKKLLLLFMVLLVAGVVVMILENSKDPAESGARTYVFESTGQADRAYIVLREDNTFQFSCSLLCSYLGVGGYTVQGNEVYCRTDDGKFEYVFVTDSGILIFDQSKSSSLPAYSQMEDGVVLKEVFR